MAVFCKFFNNYNSLIGILAALAAASLCPAGAAEISAIRVGLPTPGVTRIVIDADGPFEHSAIAETRGEGRIVLQLSGVSPGKNMDSDGSGVGHIAAFQALSPGSGLINIVIDLRKAAKINKIFEIPQSPAEKRFRLVMDLANGSTSELFASIPSKPPAKEPRAKEFAAIEDVISAAANGVPPNGAVGSPEQTVNLANPGSLQFEETAQMMPTPSIAPHLMTAHKHVIVIDAGHGGSDPGASGPDGVQESNVTLVAAKVLAAVLEKSGKYKVVLTRDSDFRLAHEERSRIARDAKADLFLSMHADAHSDAKIRGGSVYTLNEKGTMRSEREALAQDNYVISDFDVAADPKLGRVLYKVLQRKTGTSSEQFAEVLITKLAGVTPLLNNTHRRENFKVLLAPEVPAVLLELAFISNKADEANLNSDAWRQRTMSAVASAIDDYFADAPPNRHASTVQTR